MNGARLKIRCVQAIALLLTLNGCVFFTPVTGMKRLAEKTEIISGKLLGPPTLQDGGHTLILLVGTVSHGDSDGTHEPLVDEGSGDLIDVPTPKPEWNEVLYAAVKNREKKSVLAKVSVLLEESGVGADAHNVYLYGRRVKGWSFEEYTGGVDFVFEAVGIYIPIKEDYVTLNVQWGDKMVDQVSFKGFAEYVMKQGLKAIKP